ncbi:glycosyltransferase family 39 protein [Alphaproteobacteria bacterium]|nr:glycosyltransferase family 39 protein [Alphaproteobacteria bacterium]
MLFALGFLKVLAIFYTDFDLFGDEAQYWVWSKNLETGYYSKPPLLPWIISVFTLFFGNSFEALKLIPFIFYIFTGYVVYVLTLEIYNNKNLAIITALSFNIIPAVTISSFILSTDVILIFFWSLSLFFLLKIRKKTQTNKLSYVGNIFRNVVFGKVCSSIFSNINNNIINIR